jgi:hypothetical protein
MNKKVMTPEGNEGIILKGPMEFNDEIRNEMESNWNMYQGLDIDDPEYTEGEWYYVEVIRVIDGPNNIGEKLWWHEAELSFE